MGVPERRLVSLLFSDTGGGHRSAAEAIVEALSLRHPGRYELEMVDVFKEYAPRPLSFAPEMYPGMTHYPRMWGLGFHLSDGRRRARALMTVTWPYVRNAVNRLVHERRPDMWVSVHPLFITPLIKALEESRPPFITVVTDLVTTHALWFEPAVDLCLVPTEAARERAIRCGMPPGRLRVVGLPVMQRFSGPPGDRRKLRLDLGWPVELPMVLVIGGSEGMGPFYETARAIAGLGGDFGLALVAGRNEKLRQRLKAAAWEVPTFVYGFVRCMPEMMRAATLLVTKAGPGTITEAINADLPMVLYSHLPGQEEGNVTFVTEQGVGTWAPGPKKAAQSVGAWLAEPGKLKAAATKCRLLSRPEAATEVAGIIDAYFFSRASVGGQPRESVSAKA